MIYISIGIAFLAIGSIWMAQRQLERAMSEAYEAGFRDGARIIAERSYQRIENKTD